MKFCQTHWDKLRAAIDAEGIGDLVAPDEPTAVAQLVSQVEQEEVTLTNFDPLMSAHWAIIERISKHAPQVILQPGCPLCWVQDMHEENCQEPGCPITRETFEEWIPSVAAHMRETWESIRV